LRALLTWTGPKTSPAGAPITALGELGGDRVVTEAEALSLFAALGITVAEGEVAENMEHAQAVASRLGYPVAMKIASPDIAHKSDAGGVRIGLANEDDVASAYDDIIANVGGAHPDAQIDGVLVQKMHQGLGEVLLGYKRDPLVGPTIVLGLGGVLAELYGDVSLRLAPVAIDEARAMIDEVVGLASLRGYRNAPPGDLQALAQTIAAFSTMAGEKAVVEAEINPLVVGAAGDGVVAVDGLIICGAAG
jgi:succinyl-CoA synthetase beta subunit